MAQEFQMSRLLPFLAGGVGLAAAENKFIGNELDPRIKKINLAIGATTGALLAHKSPAAQIAALSGIPIKEGLLFGIGGMEKLRSQQEELTNTHLQTAKIQEDTAKTERAHAGGNKALAAAFLVPSLLGAGGVAMLAHNMHKKSPAAGSKFKTVGDVGQATGSRKVRIDIPSSAIPADFFKSITQADNTGASRIRYMEKVPSSATNGKASKPFSFSKKRASSVVDPSRYGLSDYMHGSWPGTLLRGLHREGEQAVQSKPVRAVKTIGNLALQLTGLPMLGRAAKDFGSGLGYLAGGRDDVAARYLAGGVGNALVGIPNVGFGMGGMLSGTIGKARMLRAIRPAGPGVLAKLRQGTITNTPNISQWFMNHLGRNLDKTEMAAFQNPATRDALLQRFKDDPSILGGNYHLKNLLRDEKFKFVPKPWVPTTSVPKTIPGELMHGMNFLGHHAGENARRMALMARRNPRMTAWAAGMPMSLMGNAFDQENATRLAGQTATAGTPGPFSAQGLPVSGALDTLMNNFSSKRNNTMPVLGQLSNTYGSN